jgi:two-component system, OmpR family, phosphate regulon sensor histidine kinase PhoR
VVVPVGIRGRLVLVTLLVIAVVDLLVGAYLERELRASLHADIQTELTRHAESSRLLLELADTQGSGSIEALAHRAAQATSARVTVVAEDGVVQADSAFGPAGLARLDNHAGRPEVRAAMSDGIGVASRFSDSVDADMLYVALPLDRSDGRVVVRAALPLARIDAAVGRLRAAMLLAGILSLAMAAAILLLLSSYVSRTLKSVVTAAQAAASGIHRPSKDEDVVTGSIQRMATDLETTMAMLAAERNRFHAVLQTMDQAVLALDASGRIMTVNRAARSLLELREDVEGLKLVEAVRIPGLNRLVDRARTGAAEAAEFDIPGNRRVEARATGQVDGGVVLVILDVTEIRRLERVRRDFVANVSHELRTPIAVIRANTETLLAGALEDPERAKTFVDAVLRHSERLGRLVSDLLDISRIEAGRYTLTPTDLDVRAVVGHVIDSAQIEAEPKHIALSVVVEPDLSLRADRKAMEQVLINLVTNAVKYTQDGGHVEVRVARAGREIRFEICDDGPGVDPAHRERIFERFYRVDPGRSRDMGGTGLGLSIVKHLVEAMHGHVGVEARSPRGSKFWFTVPSEAPGPQLSPKNEG